MTQVGEPKAWLLAHVAHTGDECLTWPFAKDGSGYGKLFLDGKLRGAHRVMAIWALGDPPFAKAEAAHTCHNGTGACVNPKHLKWASRRENELDKVSIGHNCGEAHPSAKLTKKQVIAMREFFHTLPIRVVADLFNISMSAAAQIRTGRKWRTV